MAVAYQSVSTIAWEGNPTGGTLVITKPTGLAAGELMVAHLSQVFDGTSDWDTPTGWTSLVNTNYTTGGGNDFRITVFYKVADSSDAAASDFTFTKNGAQDAWCAGAIYRISGQGGTSEIQYALATVEGDATPSYSNTVTPNYANSLLLFLVTAGDFFASGSVADYAITTSNPTWTERYDIYGDSGAYFAEADGLMSGATASRPEVTATGTSSVTLTNFTNSHGVIVVIPPLTNATATPNALEVTSSIPTPTISGSASNTVSVLEVTASIPSPTVSTPAATWTNTNKSSPGTWTNTSKS